MLHRSPPVTPEMAAHIKYLIGRGDLMQHEIAAKVGINQGRVSEINRGRRFPSIAPRCGPFPS